MSGNNSHKRKTRPPTLTVAATASIETSRTADNRRVRHRHRVVAHDAGPSTGGAAPFWEDDLQTNAARDAEFFSYALGDESIAPEPDMDRDDGIHVVVSAVPAAPRNANSDRPLQTWYPKSNEYVNENLRREGRGHPANYTRCRGVRCKDPLRQCPNRVCSGSPEWRCVDQGCFGERLLCAECIVASHAKLPTHFLEASCFSLIDEEEKTYYTQKWNGTHWVRRPNWLKTLGLRMQLGHPPGVVCPGRQAAPVDFVLYDITGVLNCLGKLSAYDFLRGLEKLTNNDGLNKPPDRRKPFMFIVRQWREVKRMKRAKRGHAAGGVSATKRGELVLECRQCPQPKRNLPDDWESINPVYRFLYFLFLAQDANFRLNNRNVSSEAADPIFGDGFGYFAKREGEDGYKAHIAKHVEEKEMSNCSGFQAMFMADTKRTKGLRTTGIAGVTCSRHNMWRANGMGDLQVGERQCNMDFLLLGSVMACYLLCLIVSYDIACQYSINFWARMLKLPEPMRLRIPRSLLWWKVPNFHLPPHKPWCHSPYSFHWMYGAGMTHGEGVEQNWAGSNGAAPSTRLMGPGSRHATLEDIFGFHNYERMLAMHRILPNRLATNMKEGSKHQSAFDAFSSGLEEVRPDQVAEWRALVDLWESEQHTTSASSPFELVEEVATLRDIQLEIATEEFVCTEDGVEVEREHSPGTFITRGLELEEIQRKLTIDVKALKDPSAAQRLAFTKRRTTLLKNIHKFRKVQRVYMPGLRSLLSDTQRQMLDGNGPQVPESTRLFMPSEIEKADLRGKACAMGLPEIERRMRKGEAEDALEKIRNGLRTRTMTNRYKLRNWTGQGMMTKAQGLLREINIKIQMARVRYMYARVALLRLWGHGSWEERLRVLNEDDVRALNERALTTEEKKQNEHWAELGGAVIEGGIARATGVATGEGSHTLSWIWYTAAGVAEEGDEGLHEALRVEWCRAYARTRRYGEEVRLIREEMRRTIAYGYWAAAEWDALAIEELEASSAELTEGRRGYAAEHADTERRTCAALENKWRGILERADAWLEGRMEAGDLGPVTVELDMVDELDAEGEEALLEGDME
ncbi:hypothetical protein C8R47DRAFT_1073122 [Mycena vitilis]|nr:hypothetical protein C8R47DRAFT_1073122 [Mycena vitilis]